LCKSINKITDAEKRNTLLQLVLMHANYVVVGDRNENLMQQWENQRKENLEQKDPLVSAIIKHILDGEFETELIIEGKRFVPVMPMTAEGAEETKIALQKKLGIDTTQHIDTVNFQAIKLQTYIKD
jgi:hypothetical protein